MDRLEKAIEITKEFCNVCNENNNMCLDCAKFNECSIYFDEKSPCDILEQLNKFDRKIFKDSNIVLKNIDLTEVDIHKQCNKVYEEYEEFVNATMYIHRVEEGFYRGVVVNEEDIQHAIEEYWDMVQAGLGLLQKEGISADEVMAEYPKHLKKMEDRGNKPRD